MEIDPLMIQYYLKLSLTLIGVGIASYILAKVGFKIILYLILFMLLISSVTFFAGAFTDINVSNINMGELWSHLGNLLSIIMKFFLDIFNNVGILAIISSLIGGWLGVRNSEP